jgi:hypothetical protein
MLLDALLNSSDRVTAAIRSASQTTGISFDYLMKTALRESALNPTAQASTSSARGLFQFIDTTWLQTVKDDGPTYGLTAQANQIERTADGQYIVRDPLTRAQILKLRDNPEIASTMAGAFSRRNAAEIQSVLGRAPTSGELYIAHFLGSNGAKRFLSLRASNPNASAVSAFPEAARANKSIFYNQNGARSIEQVYRVLVAKHDNIQQIAPATAVANLQVTNPPAAAEDNSPVPNLLNRIAALFSPRKTRPAGAIAPTRQLVSATAVAATNNVTANTPVVTAQLPASAVGPMPNMMPVQVAAMQNEAPMFRGLFQNQPTPLSSDVRALWGGVNPFQRG